MHSKQVVATWGAAAACLWLTVAVIGSPIAGRAVLSGGGPDSSAVPADAVAALGTWEIRSVGGWGRSAGTPGSAILLHGRRLELNRSSVALEGSASCGSPSYRPVWNEAWCPGVAVHVTCGDKRVQLPSVCVQSNGGDRVAHAHLGDASLGLVRASR